MRRLLLCLSLLMPVSAQAQSLPFPISSTPGGTTWTPAQWVVAWTGKADLASLPTTANFNGSFPLTGTPFGAQSGGVMVPLNTDGTNLLTSLAGCVATTKIACGSLGTAGAPSTNVVTIQGISSATAVPVILTGAGALPTGAASAAVQANIQGPVSPGTPSANSVLMAGIYNSSAPTFTNGNQGSIQLDTMGNIKINCQSGCSGGSGGTSAADEATFTQGTSNMVPIGGYFSTSVANLTTGQTGAAQMTNDRMLYMNLGKVNGSVPSMGAGPTGSAALRVTASQDTTTIAGSAPGTAGTASANVLTVQGVASMTPVQVSQATASNLNANITNISGTVSLPTGAATSANQTNASAKTQIVDGSGNVISATSNHLNIQGSAPGNSSITSYASGTNTAGSTFNGTSEDCRTSVNCRFWGTITNGATAPSSPAVTNLQSSADCSTWFTVASATASLTNSAVTTFDFNRPYPSACLRLQITGNVAQSITYASQGGIIATAN